MVEGIAASAERVKAALLGHDEPSDLAAVAGAFATYVAVDRAILAADGLRATDLDQPSLVVAGMRWPIFAILVLVASVAAWRSHSRLLAPWADLERGRTLRWMALVPTVLLTWQGAFYQVNFLADRLHWPDRLLVLALGIGIYFRPAFIVPFAVVFRIVNEQFVVTFGTAVGRNIDELLVIALLAIAAGHLVFVASARRQTSPILLLLSAALASHFFLPGRAKLGIGWQSNNDLANLPLASYTAGWLAQTDGWVSRLFSDLYGALQTPIVIVTLVLEVGALLVVANPRALRWWIPGWMVFHVLTFMTTGFFFLGWLALEIVVLVILVLPRFDDWVSDNATPARGLIAIVAVFSSALVFHPPGLAWFDAPVSYGFEIEAIGQSGAEYSVPISAFAPNDHELSFTRLQLAPTSQASGAYGALGTSAELKQLQSVENFDQLADVEQAAGAPTLTAESQAFIVALFDHANHGSRPWFTRLAAPSHFWTGREDPNFGFDEPLDRLQITVLTRIATDEGTISRRQVVLVVEADEEGFGIVSAEATP